jgi:negative regulator of flagellin synthesis FlgM
MTNTIPSADQRAKAIAANQGVDTPRPEKNSPPELASTSSARSADSTVELSADLKNEIAAVSFDSKKVDQIKQSIENGNYPLDDKKIAESFIPLEKLL